MREPVCIGFAICKFPFLTMFVGKNFFQIRMDPLFLGKIGFQANSAYFLVSKKQNLVTSVIPLLNASKDSTQATMKRRAHAAVTANAAKVTELS